ncbi:hypothetical protein R1sor_014214 [Riccia sorocarpa]|uniref:Uncharacterized protein n=1 Tax=Riccia sorocarpa TaxID=122646 RepID=A0ABD3HCI4_9MARC
MVSNAEVIRWLLESAHPRIEEMRIAEVAREAERVAAAEREAADAVEENDQEARWALGILNEAPRADPSQTPRAEPSHGRVQDSQPLEDIVQDSQALQPVPPNPVPANPTPTAPTPADTLPRYGFISSGKLYEFFQTFQIRCPREGCEQLLRIQAISCMHQAYKLKLACTHQHYYPFMTSEFELHYGVPTITTLMYHSALCGGLTYTQLDALYQEAGIARISKTHFMGFQSGANRRVGWIHVVLDRWAEEKAEVHRQMKELYFHEDQPRSKFPFFIYISLGLE